MNSTKNFKWNELRGREQVADVNSPWVILFHGYGADCNDLFPLADLFPVKKSWNWLFPQAPLEISLGMGWTGRAWWNLNMEKMQQDAAMGVDRDPGTESPAELPLVREKVLKMVNDLKVPWNQIVLGGFSQGGMLALDIAFHAPEKPKGLVILSSNMVSKENWQKQGKKLEGVPFYQAHGTNDTVLTFKNAQKLEAFMKQNGMVGKLNAFNGAHEIPHKTITEVGGFLDSLS